MASSETQTDPLPEWRITMIDLFVGAAQLIGYPKSVGQIYGYLYSAFQPATMDQIILDLKMSKGSVSQGLVLLRQLGAVKTHFVLGDRRDHYVAEEKAKKLFSGFLKTRLMPFLDENKDRLSVLKDHLANEPHELFKDCEGKIGRLQRWNTQLMRVLPVLHTLVDRH